MNIGPEVIDIKPMDDTPVISLNSDPIVSSDLDNKPSVNFQFLFVDFHSF